MLNKIFIQRKIKLIQEDLEKITPLAQMPLDNLAQNAVEFAAAERFLERIITRAVDINRHIIAELGSGNEQVRQYENSFLYLSNIGVYPQEFAQTIAPSAGLRNVLVHEYDDVEQKLLYDSLHKALTQYAQYCRFLLEFLGRTE